MNPVDYNAPSLRTGTGYEPDAFTPAGARPTTGVSNYLFPSLVPAGSRPSSDIIDPPLYDRPMNGGFNPEFRDLLPAGNRPNTGVNNYFPPSYFRPETFGSPDEPVNAGAARRSRNRKRISAPVGLVASDIQAGQVTLDWQASIGLFVHGYRVFRDGVEVGVTDSATLTFTDTGLMTSTSYNYTIQGVNDYGGVSPLSDVLSVTTI